MRKWTLVTIIFLFLAIGVAAIYQIAAVRGKPRNCPGPGITVDPDNLECGPLYGPSPLGP